MKKFAMMLAAGVVAFGASAQAASVESTTYAVITVPIVSGYNFIGVGVTPLDGTADTFADILGIADTDEVSVYSGTSYDSYMAGEVTANLGSAVLYDNTNGDAGTVYEVGIAPSEAASASVALSGTYTLVSSPFAAAWAPANTSLSDGSFNRFGAKANQIHIWTGSGWQTWWYKTGTGTGTGWKCKDTTVTGTPTIGAGQAVLVQKGSANTAEAVTFAAPQ